MIKKNTAILLSLMPFLAACGYKGDLYLPKEDDKARFGVIQTGLDWRRPDRQPPKPDAAPSETAPFPPPNRSPNNMSQSCENVSFQELAEEYGTPLYVYSQAALDQAFAAYQNAFSELNPLICYAVKANSNLSILRHFAKLGSGFDIVSGGELARVLAAGGDAAKTIFSGVGKSEADIRYALEQEIKCFNVESLPELERIADTARSMGKRARIAFRVNPDVDAQSHPYISTGLKTSKFGISMEEAERAYKQAAASSYLEVAGISCHIGSQIIDLAPLWEACSRVLALADRLAGQGIELQHIDLGGGIGIAYHDEHEPDLAAYAAKVAEMLADRPLQLLLEPGRSLVGNAGTLLTRVEYIKHNGEKKFVVVDAGMNDLIRPALYQAHHRIDNNADKSTMPFAADIVGPVCESSDFFAQGREIAAEAGDLLLIRSAGAYSASMASNYNSRPRSAEVLVSGSRHSLIRKRETWDDMLENEKNCL